jgi:hypothetical protein
MTDEELTEALAEAMREAYNRYIGDNRVPWKKAKPEPKAAWRATAKGSIPLVRQIEAEAEARGFWAGIERAASIAACGHPTWGPMIADAILEEDAA